MKTISVWVEYWKRNSVLNQSKNSSFSLSQCLHSISSAIFNVNSMYIVHMYVYAFNWANQHSTVSKVLFIYVFFSVSRFLEEFESNVIYDMPEPRLIGPNMEPPQFDHIQDRYVREKYWCNHFKILINREIKHVILIV